MRIKTGDAAAAARWGSGWVGGGVVVLLLLLLLLSVHTVELCRRMDRQQAALAAPSRSSVNGGLVWRPSPCVLRQATS